MTMTMFIVSECEPFSETLDSKLCLYHRVSYAVTGFGQFLFQILKLSVANLVIAVFNNHQLSYLFLPRTLLYTRGPGQQMAIFLLLHIYQPSIVPIRADNLKLFCDWLTILRPDWRRLALQCSTNS